MISMTGYGISQYQDEKKTCSLEIKSYNNRYLDLVLNMPQYLGPIEKEIRDRIGKTLKRGRVEVYLKIREKEEDLTLWIDQAAAREYKERLTELQNALEMDEALKLDQILSMEGVMKVEKVRDPQAMKPLIFQMLDDALEQLQQSRIAEGAHTKGDITENIAVIENFRACSAELAPQVEAEVKQNLLDKFQEVVGDQVEESRVLSEVAAYLVRYDINEELSRLKAHLISFNEMLALEEPVGKKMDFLCQEMNREINTIGSKSPQVEIHRRVVDAKDAMEKIREQLRNVQ